jgi:hypothetical protein
MEAIRRGRIKRLKIKGLAGYREMMDVKKCIKKSEKDNKI